MKPSRAPEVRPATTGSTTTATASRTLRTRSARPHGPTGRGDPAGSAQSSRCCSRCSARDEGTSAAGPESVSIGLRDAYGVSRMRRFAPNLRMPLATGSTCSSTSSAPLSAEPREPQPLRGGSVRRLLPRSRWSGSRCPVAAPASRRNRACSGGTVRFVRSSSSTWTDSSRHCDSHDRAGVLPD
jgi:hypothetical protein